jgi:hypothetical protein
VLTNGRDHDPRYVALVRIARGPTRTSAAGTYLDLDNAKAENSGEVLGGLLGVNTRRAGG